jgi:hypothetical protein
MSAENRRKLLKTREIGEAAPLAAWEGSIQRGYFSPYRAVGGRIPPFVRNPFEHILGEVSLFRQSIWGISNPANLDPEIVPTEFLWAPALMDRSAELFRFFCSLCLSRAYPCGEHPLISADLRIGETYFPWKDSFNPWVRSSLWPDRWFPIVQNLETISAICFGLPFQQTDSFNPLGTIFVRLRNTRRWH